MTDTIDQPLDTHAHRHHLSRRLLIAGTAFVLIALAVLVWRNWLAHPRLEVTDDAFLDGDVTAISGRVPGYVARVAVDDFQSVKAGQTLIEISDDDYRAQVAKAEADVAAAEAAVANLGAQRQVIDANIAAAAASARATAATVERNRREAARQHKLLSEGVGSGQLIDQADANASQSSAQLAQANAQTEAVRSQLRTLAAQEQQARAALAAQRATLALARINLGYTRIVAPADGAVGQKLVKPGQYLAAGGQVFSLVPRKVWVIANYRENQLTHVRVGQPATITVDTFPDATLHGHVLAFAPAAAAKFALLPPDNATGNFTKIAQRIAVKIAIDNPDGLDGRLLPGMSVRSEIDTQ